MGRRALTNDEVDSIRERISRGALKLFAEKGPEAVTLRAIAKEVGCSPMAPYRYFPGGKREILVAARTDAFRRFAERQEAVLSGLSGKAVELVELLGLAYVEFGQEDPASFRIMFEVEPTPEDEFPELAAQTRRVRRPLIRAVVQAVEEGDLNGDPLLVAQVLWAGLHGLVSLHLAGQLQFGYGVKELLPHLTATLRAGAVALK